MLSNLGGIDPLAWRPAQNWGRRLQWHFDATVSSSITIATGVSQWSDLSGNARHITQGTAAAQPANGGDIGGRNAITFSPSGTIDQLEATGLTAVSTDTLAVFIVAKFGSGSGNYARLASLIVGAGSDETAVGAFAMQREALTAQWRIQRNSVTTTPQTITYDAPFIGMAVWNASTQHTRTKNVASATASSTGTFIGDHLWMGYNLAGSIGEWIAAKGPFAEGELNRQYRALANKWRIL